MRLDEYEQTGKALYWDFAVAVASILDAALKANGSIRVQAIQKRAKAAAEVRKKLDSAADEVESKVKDLAGARIVVYSNSDVTRLMASDILLDNFEIVWDRTKIHFPAAESRPDESQFVGQNYVVRLKDSRAGLIEYNRFAGLQCEVQIQTILDHSWSETAHDTIYKSPRLDGVGQAQMAKIQERMYEIQRKYLRPAGYEFQQVLNDFERIVSGQRLVKRDILAAIVDAPNNNVRVELLEQYATVVLPIIDDKGAAAPEIRSMLIEAARNAISLETEPHETPIGALPGKTHEAVLDKIIGILRDIQYVEPADTYAAYVELSAVFREPSQQEKIVAAVGQLAQHSLDVWRRYGPAVEEILLDAVQTAPESDSQSARRLSIKVLCKCLEPEVTGLSSTSSTVTWTSGPVVVSERLHAVRDRALLLLQELFTSSLGETERDRIYRAMKAATRLPNQGKIPDPLIVRVLEDSASITKFFARQRDSLSQLMKEKVEHDTLFQYRRANELPSDVLEIEGVRTARDALIEAARDLRERFNADPEFVTFKTLVGFQSVFPEDWDDDEEAGFEAQDTRRHERADEYVATVTEVTADEWFDRVNGYAAIESSDLAMFPELGRFVSRVAEASPEIALSWLDRSRGEPLARFRPAMLLGLNESDRERVLRWIAAAIDRKDDLSGIAHFLRFAEPAAPDLLERVAKEAFAIGDDNAAYKVLETCAARPTEFGMPLARSLAIDALVFLSSRSQHHWITPLRGFVSRSGLLTQFEAGDRSKLFEAIIDLPSLDFRVEEILALYAEEHAAEIIELFGRRLERERRERQRAVENGTLFVGGYEAIPFAFHRLHKSMQHTGPMLLAKAVEWHRADPSLGQFKSARLVCNVFPNLPEGVRAQLIGYAQSGDRAAQQFVIDVMANYEGAAGASAVLKELVAVLAKDDELLKGVSRALRANGVMHGEFGYRDVLSTKRKQFESWLTDKREPVRRFAVAFVRSLDNEINAAQQQAEEDIAMRKLSYGEYLNDEGSGLGDDQD